jgi:methylmalonyl-CoA mutase
MASDTVFDCFPDVAALFQRPSLDAWRTAAETSLKGKPLEKLSKPTPEGLVIDPLYTDTDGHPNPGVPGASPHVRGRTALGAGPAGWSICQVIDHPDPEQAAARITEELGRGVDALWLVFDGSVRRAAEDAGSFRGDGIRIRSAADLASLVERLDPTRHSVHLDAGGNAPAVAAAFVAASRKAGLNLHELEGSIGFDPMGALAADGELTAGIDGSYAALAELIAWTRLRAPGLRAGAVSTVPHHMAGATAVQELAYALATAVESLRRLENFGLDPDAVARQLVFRFAVGRELFMEAAKLRAFRRLWSRAAEVCGVADDGRAAVTHAVASPRGLTTRDPWVNALRTTVGGFAAVAGGADIITVLPFDHAVGHSDELGRRIAANSQTIIKEESNLARVVDPGGGSWYLENLTDELAGTAWSLFQSIETASGMAAALLEGEIATQLEQSRTARSEAVATRRDPITGVSSYPNLGEEPVERPPASPRAEAESSTPTEELARAFTAAAAPGGDGELVDAAISAADAGAGIGPIAVALRGTREAAAVAPLTSRRDAAGFEGLRDASDERLAATGSRPRIFLANMGPIPEHKPRAGFATNFFEAGGIETLSNQGFDSVEAAVEAFSASGAGMAVICSSDARYPEVVPPLAAALEGAGARTVLLAGKPGEHEEEWRSAGVTGFIHLGCNVHQMLVDLLQEEGVLHV